jgi:hypothetical protein
MPLGQRIAHMRSEERLSTRDPSRELVPSALDGLPKVEIGKPRGGVVLTRIGDLAEHAGEVAHGLRRPIASDVAWSSRAGTRPAKRKPCPDACRPDLS